MSGEVLPSVALQKQVEVQKIEVLFRNTSFTLINNLLLSSGLV